MKKQVARGLAGALAVCMVASAVGYNVMHKASIVAEAAPTMYGIESLIADVSASKRTFTILEIVPDLRDETNPDIVIADQLAEIGYMVPGYEPVLSTRDAQTGKWKSWEENLGQYDTFAAREDYMKGLKGKLDAYLAKQGFNENNPGPVSYVEYQESDTPKEGYKYVSFANKELIGYFEEVRNPENLNGRYDLNFYADGEYRDLSNGFNGRQYYYVNKTDVKGNIGVLSDDTILFTKTNDEYSKADMTLGQLKEQLNELIKQHRQEQETVSQGDGTVSPGDGDQPKEDEYVPTDEDYENVLEELTVSYYYDVTFYPILVYEEEGPINPTEPVYLVDETSIRENSTDGQYTLHSVENGYVYSISTNGTYYSGGFVNNEWFRNRVLNMDPDQYENFPVEVVTLTETQLNQMNKDKTPLPEFDLLYLNSGYTAQGKVSYDGNSQAAEYTWQDDLYKAVTEKGAACIVDAAILYKEDGKQRAELKGTPIFYLCAKLTQINPSRNTVTDIDVLFDGIGNDPAEGADADHNFVTENVYCFYQPIKMITQSFSEATIYKEGENKACEPGFKVVLDEIKSENSYRETDASNRDAAGNPILLSTDISQATVIRHIINYRYRRNVLVKTEINVLDLEPAYAREEAKGLDERVVKSWIKAETDVLNGLQVNITRMTTAEFIGRIEDINEIYDVVYIGTDTDRLNTEKGTTVFNDTNMNGLIYYHVGDMRYGSLSLAGQLETNYINDNNGKQYLKYYNPVRYGGNDITQEKLTALNNFLAGAFPVVLSDDFFTYNTPVTLYENIDYDGYAVPVGVGRYDMARLKDLGAQDDDITSLKIKQGYEVVLYDEDGFTGEGNDKVLHISADKGDLEVNLTDYPRTVGNRWNQYNWNDIMSSMVVRCMTGKPTTINTDHIDDCSYMYEFVSEALKKETPNLFSQSEVSGTVKSDLFNFYLNRPKIQIKGWGNADQVQVTGVKDQATDVYKITQDAKGRFTLEYKFKIENKGAASNNTGYTCQLFVDVNADGKYSNNEELKDTTILWNGQALKENELLYAGREYTLSRTVPDGYKGVLPWKIQITQENNACVHGGTQGYTKLQGLPSETINILQISRNVGNALNLQTAFSDQNNIYHKLIYGDGQNYAGIKDDFEISVRFMYAADFCDEYEKEIAKGHNILDDYNMLIFGFADMYDDIRGTDTTGPLGAVIDFINSGKSVLFAHDTLGFINYDYFEMENDPKEWVWKNDTNDADKNNANIGNANYGNWPRRWRGFKNVKELNNLAEPDATAFGLNMLHYLRNLMGQDKYGISINGDLKKGSPYSPADTDVWKILTDSKKEIAYKPKSGKSITVPEVQGYTYALINNYHKKEGDWTTYTENEVGIPGGWTEKYLNLNFGTVYNNSEKTVQPNNIGNGEVNNLMVTRVNSGQITDYPYKLPETFAVAPTHCQYNLLDFTADDDDDGQSDLVVWYCLGGTKYGDGVRDTIYSASPNDVANNYYIYNKGNITYTGVGHSGNNTNYEDEAKLFINTMIAAYNAGVQPPTISVLDEGKTTAQAITSSYSYYDDENKLALDENAAVNATKIYFMANDINFIKGQKSIVVNLYYADENGKKTIQYSDKNAAGENITQAVKVSALANCPIYELDGTVVNKDSQKNNNELSSGKVYYISVPDKTIQDIIKTNARFRIYFEGTTVITNEGLSGKKMINTVGPVYTQYDITRINLFDLQ